MARLTIRIDLSDDGAIGPGKIRLLERRFGDRAPRGHAPGAR